jgi:hypothetical protein
MKRVTGGFGLLLGNVRPFELDFHLPGVGEYRSSRREREGLRDRHRYVQVGFRKNIPVFAIPEHLPAPSATLNVSAQTLGALLTFLREWGE